MIASAWTAFKGSKFMGYAIAAFAAVAAVLIVIVRAFGAGKASEKADQFKREADIRRKADEVERTVDRADDTELGRLRDKWTR